MSETFEFYNLVDKIANKFLGGSEKLREYGYKLQMSDSDKTKVAKEIHKLLDGRTKINPGLNDEEIEKRIQISTLLADLDRLLPDEKINSSFGYYYFSDSSDSGYDSEPYYYY